MTPGLPGDRLADRPTAVIVLCYPALLERAAERAATHALARIEDVGAYAAFLASPLAASVTGGVHYIDGGYNVVG